MARLPRLAIGGQLHHLIHHALPDRSLCLADADMSAYREALLSVSRDLKVLVHAYALLPNRVHLLVTPPNAAALTELMQRVGRRFVGASNALHGLTGSPWAGRYRGTVLQPEPYLLAAMRLIDTAASQEGLVTKSQDWPASSAAHYFGQRGDPLVTPHALYWQLGNTPFEREEKYRAWCAAGAEADTVSEAITNATIKGWALGDAAYLAGLAESQARRLQPGVRGRPRGGQRQP